MPTTTTGIATEFITFSRPGATGGGATVTDSDGRIKWAPHNLLLASEQFDAASWAKVDILSTTANSTAAPNGTITADLIIPSATNQVHTVAGGSVSATSATYSVFVKASGYTKIGLREGATSGAGAAFDISGSGSVIGAYNAGGSTVSDMSCTALANGWFLLSCKISFASATTLGFMICALNTSYSSGDLYVAWTPNGTSGFHLWGAHLYRSDLAMQPNTSAYPMYNPTTAKNLLGFTENFDNAAWVKTNTTVTGGVVAPNGLSTAFRIEASPAAGAGQQFYQNSTVIGSGPYVCSIYAKQGSGPTDSNSFLVYNNTTPTTYANITINFATGAITQTAGSGASATNVGNGWWRISLPFTSTATVGNTVRFYAGSVGAVETPGEFFYAWGAQISDSASLDAYTPNHFAAPSAAAYYGPRRDFDPVTLACKGLLVEEQRANLLLRSAEFDNASWSKSAATVTANAGVSPDGTSSAEKIVESATTAQHYILQSLTTTATAHTFSVYAKAGERSFILLQCDTPAVLQYFNLSTGALGSATGSPTSTITPVGNGWYRCAMTFTAVAATPAFYVILASANGTSSYAGDGTSGAFVYGAQVEAGSFATSYIPTGSATATRTVDVATVSTQAFPYGAAEGTLVISADTYDVGSSAGLIASLSAGLTSNSVLVGLFSNKTSLSATVGGSPQAFLQPSGTVSTNTVFKAGGAFATNSFIASSNGTLSTEDPSGSVPTGITTLGIGIISTVIPINGHIRQITYLPRRVTNAELQTRTTL